MIVVDDRLLFETLAGTQPDELTAAAGDGIATTFSWYYRLARAVATRRIEGTLSRRFADLPVSRQSRVAARLDDLSDRVEIVGPKDLVPVMSALSTVVTVNLLTADALASAMILDAPILTTTRSGLLSDAASQLGVEVIPLLTRGEPPPS